MNHDGLAAAIELIGEKAKQAEAIVVAPREPSHVYYIRTTAGEWQRVAAIPRPIGCEFYALDDLASAAHRLRKGDMIASQVCVFVGRDSVVLVLDMDGDRRDRLSMALPLSHEFHELEKLRANRSTWNHESFLRFLRLDLSGCLEPGVLPLFRRLKVSNHSDGESAIETGKESIGRSIKRELLLDGGAVPEEIIVSVHVYQDLPDLFPDHSRMHIRCAVEIDPQVPAFALVPYAGECERARLKTDQQIIANLKAALPGVPVFSGEAE